MATRKIVRDLNAPPEIEPASRAFDSYVRAPSYTDSVARPGEDNLRELTRSLGIASDELFQASKIEHQHEIDEAFKAGRQAFDTTGNRRALADAVREGVIPVGANPWFIKGYNQQNGVLLASEYRTGLHTLWSTSEARESDDPQAIGKLITEYKKQFFDTKLGQVPNPDIVEGLTPGVREADYSLTSHHIAYRQHEITKRALENTGRQVGQLIDEAIRSTVTLTPDGYPQTDYAAVGTIISAQSGQFVKDGLSGSLLNKAIIDAVEAKALEYGDPYMMEEVLARVKTPGGSLAGTTAAREAIYKATLHIRNLQRDEIRWGWSVESREWSVEDRAWTNKSRQRQIEVEWPRADEAYARAKTQQDREELARSAAVRLVMDIEKNPGKPLDATVVQDLIKADPFMYERVRQIRENMLDSREKVREDDTWIRAQYADMIQDPNGYDPRRIISGAAQRRIDTARMVSMIGDWRTRKEEEAGPMGGREFKEIVNGLSDMVRTGKEGIATGASAANAVNAVEELKDWTRVYLQKNPNASPAELRLEARKKRDELFKRFNELGSEEAVKKPGASSSRSSSETPAAPDTKSPALDVALKGFNDERTYILNYLGNATLHAPGEIPTWTQRLADIEKKIKAVESLPPAGKHKGKTVVDEETGLKFKSDGKTWSPAR